MNITNYEFLTLLIGVLTLIFILIRVLLLSKTFKADHERKRKQSTIEYLNTIRSQYLPLQLKVTRIFGFGNNVKIDELNDDIEDTIVELLAILENLSIGVNIGVYDIQVVNRYSGDYFINLYNKLQPYIDHLRYRDSKTSYFIEFENMKDTIIGMRKKSSEKGNIQYS